jgi:polysaccharide export outer membrane protein
MKNKMVLLPLVACMMHLAANAQAPPQSNPTMQTSPLPAPRVVAPDVVPGSVCSDAMQCMNTATPAGTSPAIPRTGPIVLGSASGPATSESAIKIGPGDLVMVQVFDIPELTQVVRVSWNGLVSLSLIGSIKIDDLTTSEAADLIISRLKEGHFIKSPEVSVFIQEYATQGVSVLGEVRQPGLYPAVGPRKLLDLLSQAGGVTPAAASEVTIRRRDGTEQHVNIDMSGTANQMIAANVDIDPGDTVILPRVGVVYVVGEVVRPGGYIMQDSGSLSVLQAIALAQGHTTLASLNHAIILHREGGRETVRTDVPIKKILQGRQPDIQLTANDVLYLPRNVPKAAALIGLDDTVRGLTALAYYAR